MADVVRAAPVQATWTGDTESMVTKHVAYAREAARQGAEVIAINRVGQEEYGDDDFYGTSCFVDPRGQFVGEAAGDRSEELVVRDLDFDLIEEVRQQWAFHRDRRPDAYEGLVQP